MEFNKIKINYLTKRNLIFVLFILILVIAFIILNRPSSVRAAKCKSPIYAAPFCNDPSYCGWNRDDGGQWVCTIHKVSDPCSAVAGKQVDMNDQWGCSSCGGQFNSSCYFSDACTYQSNNCSNDNIICNTASCPDTGDYDGKVCTFGDGTNDCWGIAQADQRYGNWDASNRQCIECSGKIKGKRLADRWQRCADYYTQGWPACGLVWTDLVCAYGYCGGAPHGCDAHSGSYWDCIDAGCTLYYCSDFYDQYTCDSHSGCWWDSYNYYCNGSSQFCEGAHKACYYYDDMSYGGGFPGMTCVSHGCTWDDIGYDMFFPRCESGCGAPSDLDEDSAGITQIKDLSCPSSVAAGTNFAISYKVSGTTDPHPYEIQTIEGGGSSSCIYNDNLEACNWHSKSQTLTASNTPGNYAYTVKVASSVSASSDACGSSESSASCTIAVGCNLARTGNYSVNFTCELTAGDHYLINGDLTITTGGTVKVNSGANLRIDSGHKISLEGNGKIEMNGGWITLY